MSWRGDSWVNPFGPRLNEVYVNPGQLRLWGDAEDTGWGELMGTLEILVTNMQITPGSRARITVR